MYKFLKLQHYLFMGENEKSKTENHGLSERCWCFYIRVNVNSVIR